MALPSKRREEERGTSLESARVFPLAVSESRRPSCATVALIVLQRISTNIIIQSLTRNYSHWTICAPFSPLRPVGFSHFRDRVTKKSYGNGACTGLPPTALRADALIKWRVDSAFDFVRPRVDTEKHPPSLTAAVSHPKLDYWFKEIGSRVVVVEDFPFSFYLPLRNIVSRHLGIDAIPLRMRPFSQHQIVVHLQKGADIIRDYTGTELGVVM